MCDKCQQLEKKIERYRKVAFSINDQPTIDRLNELIKDMEAEKAKKYGRLSHRRYPASVVLRTSPHPLGARPVPRGRPVDHR